MTIEQAFIQFLALVNRNATNNKVNVDKPRFVLLFNDMQRRYVEWILEKRNSDTIRYLQKILINEFPLVVQSTVTTFSKFTLPQNYFDFSNISVYASTECCGKRRLSTFEAKSENREELLVDVNNNPTFEFEETFYYFSEDSIVIYRDGFNIDSVLLTYYRYPLQVDIAGYINLNNAASTSINPEFDDKVVNRVLIAMAKEFSAINSDTDAYQLDKDRLFTEV